MFMVTASVSAKYCLPLPGNLKLTYLIDDEQTVKDKHKTLKTYIPKLGRRVNENTNYNHLQTNCSPTKSLESVSEPM